MNVVISQSMYFPWVGLLEQVRLADVFVHYDDVQFARGFFNRVQIKTEHGSRWITVPLRDHHRGQLIDQTLVDPSVDWRRQHRDILKQAYRHAPFAEDMLEVVDSVFRQPLERLSDVARESVVALCRYFGLAAGKRLLNSCDLASTGASSQRLLDMVLEVGGDTYVTGHGAKNYLDHELFERAGIRVCYMDYECRAYRQLHGAFTPYVSSLDLIANLGPSGVSVIRSAPVYWRDFLHRSWSVGR